MKGYPDETALGLGHLAGYSVGYIFNHTQSALFADQFIMCPICWLNPTRNSGTGIPRPFSLWKLALWIITFATAFNALTSHYGQTVLFIIPGKLPLISGKVTLEAVVYGATNGLILIGILASFLVLTMALRTRELIRLIPRAFFPVAVVSSIAVTYLPTTLRQFQQIREAQAIRGPPDAESS